MAKIIYSTGNPCIDNRPEKIMTHDTSGISLEPSRPDPDGFQQTEAMVIRVSIFNLDSAEPWRVNQDINAVQAREIGKWLCRQTAPQPVRRLRRLLRLDR